MGNITKVSKNEHLIINYTHLITMVFIQSYSPSLLVTMQLNNVFEFYSDIRLDDKTKT